MINIGICDDEEVYRKEIEEYVRKICMRRGEAYYIKTYGSAEQVLLEGEDFTADILFLDVYLMEMNGLELAKEIRKKNSEVIIIFVTRAIELAREGYKVKAFRYIIKPIDVKEFNEEFENALKEWEEKESHILTLKVINGVRRIESKEILYIETSDRGVNIHTNQEILFSNLSLNLLEEQLKGKLFMRVHRSFIINIKYVTTLEKDSVVINGEHRVLVSRYKLKQLKEKVFEHIKGMI